MVSGRDGIILVVVAISGLVLGGIAGGLIAYYAVPREDAAPQCGGWCMNSDVPQKLVEDATPGITDRIKSLITTANIKSFHTNFSSYPHLAGTPGDDILAQSVFDIWKEQGLDYVTRDTYEILLSYPNQSDPNYVYLIDDTGGTVHRTQTVEKILTPGENHPDVVPPFNAYSPAGDVQGELVYVNYGRTEDYDVLKNYNISVSGKIAIARYGNIFRGDKVHIAYSQGAIGLIIYSDPADYSLDINDPVYPNSWWLPGTGVQRGTIYTGPEGDPLTPGYPSTVNAYRLNESQAELPQIPVHPIGYDDAYHFLSILSGPEVPQTGANIWQGYLNFTYRFGPGFDEAHQNWTVRLHVATFNQRRNTSNVFGYIRGGVEPDRYVLLGNHRDAWVFGAVDPTSGTAVMMEVSRVLSEIVQTDGWRPRRTIVFCSWGAEEYGKVGSYEWVQQYLKNMLDRTVVYLNVDLAFEGQASMRARGIPIVTDFLYDVAKRIQSANNQSETLYDEWLRLFPDKKDKTRPRVVDLGSGSDYASFIGIAGVPSLDVRYTHNYSIIDYPLYHSVYETIHLINSSMDPDFKYSLAIGQYWAEAARYMSDSLFLPLNASRYAEGLRGMIDDLDAGYGQLMTANGVSLDGLYGASDKFTVTANDFTARRSNVNVNNPMETRMYNEQLVRLERAFLDSEGLPLNRSLHKHVLYAPSSFDSYAGTTFPGLVDLMWGIEDIADLNEQNARWEDVKKHLATIIYTVESASTVLRETTQFN